MHFNEQIRQFLYDRDHEQFKRIETPA